MCTKCKRKRRSSKVGMLGVGKVDIPQAVIDRVIQGGEVVAGFMSAEWLAQQARTVFTNKDTGETMVTPNISTAIKVGGAVITTVAAFSKAGKPYQDHLLTLAGGMAANAVATFVKGQLPDNLQSLVPSVAGIRTLSDRRRQVRIPSRATATEDLVAA